MISVLVPTTTWDASSSVESLVSVETSGGLDLKVTPGPPDLFTIPDNTTEVTITVLPVPDQWWRADVVLTVDPGGTLKVKDRGDAAAVDIVMLVTGAYAGAKVVIRLSRVKVVTDQVVASVTTPDRVPPIIPPQPGDPALAAMIANTNAERQLAVRSLIGGTSPVAGKKLHLPSLSPLPMIDPATPVSGGLLTFTVGAVAPANDTFVVEVAGIGSVPKTIAVSWPDSVPRDQPAPMYVYYRHAPRQETDLMVGKYSNTLDGYPYGFDYVYFCLLTCLWYSFSPDLLPYSQGIPYQIEASGKKVVTIVACPTARPNNKSTQFGDWTSADFVRDLLLEIQALAAARGGAKAPGTLGRVAVGAFSSSHWHLLNLLKNNKGHPFLTGTVKECYLFDPDNIVLADLMPHLLDWYKGVPANAAIIRLYNHGPMPEQKPLISPVPTSTPHLTTATAVNGTVFAAASRDWDRSIAALRGKASRRAWTWPDQHFAIAAFMLTHAIANSGF
mgnify:FL=1